MKNENFKEGQQGVGILLKGCDSKGWQNWDLHLDLRASGFRSKLKFLYSDLHLDLQKKIRIRMPIISAHKQIFRISRSVKFKNLIIT